MKNNYNTFDDGKVKSQFVIMRNIVITLIVITAVITVAVIITTITRPEVIGEFMGKIVNGFNSTIK